MRNWLGPLRVKLPIEFFSAGSINYMLLPVHCEYLLYRETCLNVSSVRTRRGLMASQYVAEK
jgi:hypothetical protein